MSEMENRLPITKERLARFEAYSNEDAPVNVAYFNRMNYTRRFYE